MRRPKHRTTNGSVHPFSLSLVRPAIICYVRDSKLTGILAFCHSYVSWPAESWHLVAPRIVLLDRGRARGEQSPFPRDKEIRRKPKEGSRDTHLSLAFQFSATFSCSQLLGSCTSYRISEFLYSKWGVFVGWSYPCATRWIIVFLVYIIFQIYRIEISKVSFEKENLRMFPNRSFLNLTLEHYSYVKVVTFLVTIFVPPITRD